MTHSFRIHAVWMLTALVNVPASGQSVTLVASDPANGAVVEQPPRRLALRYDAPLDGTRSHLELLNGRGHRVPLISSGLDPTEPEGTSLEAQVQPLPDGQYSLRWSVAASKGGGSHKGEVNFRVDTVSPLKRAAPAPDSRTTKSSAKGTYRVSYELPGGPVRVNALHTWKVRVTTADAKTASKATLSVAGAMPIHAHGLPTTPQVSTRASEPGVFHVEGLKFQMPGHWRLTLTIDSDAGKDEVFFDVVLNR